MKTIPSIETQKKMHAFFMKTSAPRLHQQREATKKDKEVTK